MRRFRHPRVLLFRLLAIALALATARLVAVDLAMLHRRARDLGPLVHVVEADRDLAFGSIVRANDVRVVERYQSQRPSDSLDDVDDAIGRTIVVPVVAGTPLFASHLADPERVSTAEVLAPGHVAIRVASEDGLRPRVGDVVRVLAVIDPGTGVSGRTQTVADHARVLASGDDDSAATTNAPAAVLLEVTDAQAADIAFAAAHGVITLALLAPEDACCDVDST